MNISRLGFAAALFVTTFHSSLADAAWRKAITNRFIIYSEETPEDLKAYATQLEEFDQAVRLARGMPIVEQGPTTRLTVYAVRDVYEVQKLAGGASSIAGFYIPRYSGSIAVIPRKTDGFSISADTVFFHEYAHHIMLQHNDGPLPKWLVEGFAEFYSTAKFEKDGAVGFGMTASHRADTFRYIQTIPLRRMMAPNEKFDGAETQMLYAKGWLLTHYLAFNKERAGQLTKYIANFRGGMDELKAAEQAFGDLNKLDGELESYLREPRLPYATVAADRIAVGPIVITDLPAGENAILPAVIQSAVGVSKKTAPKVADEARQIAAQYPKDALVQSELAEAEFDVKNYQASLAAANAAIAGDPTLVRAHSYQGRAMLALAKTPADFDAARRAIMAGNRIDPDNPQPLVLFYAAFRKQGIKPTANALEALLFAGQLVPQDSALRVLVVHALMDADRPTDAAKELVPLVYAAHGGGDTAKLHELMNLLKANDIAGARKYLVDNPKLLPLEPAGGDEN